MRSRADAAPAFVYIPELEHAGSALTLTEEESHYLTRVCRARQGERVTATDGFGRVSTLRLESIGPRVRVAVERTDLRVRGRRGWVWSGAPEGDRADWMVEKLAELGVETWQPLVCERGSWERAGPRGERWRRLAVAALRQSRRPFLMEVREPIELAGALADLPDDSDRWVASAEGSIGVRSDPSERLQVGAIGPSAGFTDRERASLEAAGFKALRLSDGRLRTESAALAWAVWWSLA